MALDRSATTEKTGSGILAAAMQIHSALGPGLLESAYEHCLDHALRSAGMRVERQVVLPMEYQGERIEAGFRIDLLVEG